jgi:hypothetical protein
MMNDNRHTPNLFWPILLIGVGGLLLLTNLEVIDAVPWEAVWRLWPVFLVAAGINLLFGRGNRWLASLFSALLGIAVIAFLFFAPMIVESLPTPEMVTESFAEPGAGIEAAAVTLDFDRGNLTVDLLEDSTNFFEVVVSHDEELHYSSSGNQNRTIRLNLNDIGTPQFGFFFGEQSQINGDVGIAAGVPINLRVNIGGGSADLFLEELDLTQLRADSGSGSLEVILPGGSYPVRLSSGSGSITVESAQGVELDLRAEVGSGRITLTLGEDSEGEIYLDSGSGSINLVIPEGLAVEVSGDTGSGSVNVPNDFVRTSGDGSISGDSGTWQSPGFADSDSQLYIRFDIGSGSLRVEYP